MNIELNGKKKEEDLLTGSENIALRCDVIARNASA